MESLFWIGFVGAAMAGIYALIQAKKVMTFSEGTERMKQIAGAIREGANAYLQRQYKTVLPVFAAVFVILMAIAFASGGDMLSKFTPFAKICILLGIMLKYNIPLFKECQTIFAKFFNIFCPQSPTPQGFSATPLYVVEANFIFYKPTNFSV